LLLHNRNKEISEHSDYNLFLLVMKVYKYFALHTKIFDIGFNGIKNLFLKTLGRNAFSHERILPSFKKSFRKSYIG
jgi:hypothetical protein